MEARSAPGPGSAFFPLVFEGWSCRRLELGGEDHLRARFEARQSGDFVEVEIVPRDASGAFRRLEHCAVRYRAKVSPLATWSRDKMGNLVMGTASAVEARLAAFPGTSIAQAFGRRGAATLTFSPETVRDWLAPDIIEGQELIQGWSLRSILPAAARFGSGDKRLQILLTFSHAISGREVQLTLAARDDSRPALARTAHLSITHGALEQPGADAVETLLSIVAFYLQVRDHAGVELQIPEAPPELLPTEPQGEPVERLDLDKLPFEQLEPTTSDAWDLELKRLLGELKKKNLACIKPWVTAERLGGWQVLPCCQRFLKPEVLAECDPKTESFMEAWNSPGIQAVRKAIVSGQPHDTCREDCPQFHGPDHFEESLFTRPTSQAMYDNMVSILNSMLEGKEKLETTPLHVQFSIETKCNIHCVMCSVVNEEPGKEFGGGTALDDVGAKELVREFPRIKNLRLMGGEPTMAPLTRELLAKYNADEFPDGWATMITNGILLTPKYTEVLRKTRLDIMVSINAATPETYERVTGRKGGFERVVKNVKALLDPNAGFAVPPRVQLSYVVMKDTYREVPIFLELAKELGCTIRLQAIYGELGGQSLFTNEALLRDASEFFDREVLPSMDRYHPQFRVSAERVAHMMRSRLERRDFSPY